MAAVYRRPAARRDLIAHYAYLTENAGDSTADRFLNNAEVSFDDLAKQPTMGAPLMLRRSELAGMRKWRVRGFDNHLIFYMLHREDISIVRVLHPAQDWWAPLGMAS